DGGATTINTTAINTSGSQTYNGAVTLSQNATLTATGGDVTFDSALDGTHAFTVSAGNVTFDGLVGSSHALTSLTDVGATTITSPAIRPTGSQTYNGAVTLSQDATLTATG